jgi:hypothetical protein
MLVGVLLVRPTERITDHRTRREGTSTVVPRSLVERRTQPGRWIFAATGIVLALFGLFANEYGTHVPYGTLGALCLAHAFYPTMLGWGFVLAMYAGASLLYVYMLMADAIRVARSQQPEVFLNPSDTAVFLIFISSLIMLTVAVTRCRPLRSARPE